MATNYDKDFKKVLAELEVFGWANPESWSDIQKELLNDTILSYRIVREKHSPNFHAKKIISELTSRPNLQSEGGSYDMLADEAQMVQIVEKYLTRHYY